MQEKRLSENRKKYNQFRLAAPNPAWRFFLFFILVVVATSSWRIRATTRFNSKISIDNYTKGILYIFVNHYVWAASSFPKEHILSFSCTCRRRSVCRLQRSGCFSTSCYSQLLTFLFLVTLQFQSQSGWIKWLIQNWKSTSRALDREIFSSCVWPSTNACLVERGGHKPFRMIFVFNLPVYPESVLHFIPSRHGGFRVAESFVFSLSLHGIYSKPFNAD